MAVSAHDLATLGITWGPPGPAFVHGVANIVVDCDGYGGVTSDPLDRLAIDQAVSFELTGQLAGFVCLRDQGVERDVDDDEVRAR